MSPKKCPRKVTQKGDISWTILSTRCHQKCPRNVTSFVHEMSPIMSTKCLPPVHTWQINRILLASSQQWCWKVKKLGGASTVIDNLPSPGWNRVNWLSNIWGASGNSSTTAPHWSFCQFALHWFWQDLFYTYFLNSSILSLYSGLYHIFQKILDWMLYSPVHLNLDLESLHLIQSL